MSLKAKLLQRLYLAGRVGISGLRKAVEDSTITAGEYAEITGDGY